MASICEECSDSIGDKRCIDCNKLFCLNCKLDHLTIGQHPGHIFHNVQVSTEKKSKKGKVRVQSPNSDTILNDRTIMSEFGIEDLQHQYGFDPENIPDTVEDNKQSTEDNKPGSKLEEQSYRDKENSKDIDANGSKEEKGKDSNGSKEEKGKDSNGPKEEKGKDSNGPKEEKEDKRIDIAEIQGANQSGQKALNQEEKPADKEEKTLNESKQKVSEPNQPTHKNVSELTSIKQEFRKGSEESKDDNPEINSKIIAKSNNKMETHIDQKSPHSQPSVTSETVKEKNIFELTETGDSKVDTPRKSPEEIKTNKYKLKTEKSAYSILEMTSMCTEHEESFIFICDRCDIPVCRNCVVREHKGHKLSDIEETALMRENALATTLTPRIAGAVSNSSEMNLHLSTFDSEINEVNRAILRHGEALKELIDKQSAMMIKHVNERAKRKKTVYNEVNETLNDAVEKGRYLQNRYQELARSKNDGATILQLKKLTEEANSFNYPSVPRFPSVRYLPPKVSDVDIAALFGAFNFIDMDSRTTKLPRIIPPPNISVTTLRKTTMIYSIPRHRWQCCRCGTEQVNDTIRIYNNNLFFDCAKCRRSMYHQYRGRTYE